jgi:hypothetical protein
MSKIIHELYDQYPAPTEEQMLAKEQKDIKDGWIILTQSKFIEKPIVIRRPRRKGNGTK